MTVREAFDSVSNGGASDFGDVVEILNAHKPWCLIGGLAVNCYVEPVYTMDVDLVVIAKNLDPIGHELEKGGFKVRHFEHSMNAQRAGSKLNIQFTTDVRYQAFLDQTSEQEVFGISVPVAILQNIILGKVWAWQNRRSTKRKKDELDLMRIAEAFPSRRGLIPGQIVAQL